MKMALLPVKRSTGVRSDLARLHDEMDDLVRSFFEPWEMPVWSRGRWPAVDVAEKEDRFLVKAEVPGCKAEDIDISMSGNILTISGEKKREEETKEKGYYQLERWYGSFRRDLSLAGDVDPAKIDAVCKDGVLTITLPKTEKAKAVKVKVRA
jgi:HSP20 family protein